MRSTLVGLWVRLLGGLYGAGGPLAARQEGRYAFEQAALGTVKDEEASVMLHACCGEATRLEVRPMRDSVLLCLAGARLRLPA